MKKSLVHTFFALLIVLCLSAIISGCSSLGTLTGSGTRQDTASETPQPAPVSVAIVLGAHANAQALNLANPEVTGDVTQATESGGLVVVICADGAPQIISANIYTVPQQYQGNPELLQSEAEKRAAAILSSLSNVKAAVPEVDDLQALWQAVRALAAAPAGSQKMIDIIDTGLSTCGSLNFCNNLLAASPDTITDFLVSQEAIPDLSGITVNWYQLGDTASPQPNLSYADTAKLQAIWNTVITQGGGAVTFSALPSGQGTNDASSYPAVSMVSLSPQLSLTFNPEQDSIFTEEQVQFVGDSDQYIDPAAAQVALTPVADYLKAHPDFTALLVGTTATCDEDYCLNLSQARADAVKNTLITMGVPGDQMVTKGLSFHDPWHVQDEDAGGHQIESLAAANRKVVIMPLTASNLDSLGITP